VVAPSLTLPRIAGEGTGAGEGIGADVRRLDRSSLPLIPSPVYGGRLGRGQTAAATIALQREEPELMRRLERSSLRLIPSPEVRQGADRVNDLLGLANKSLADS
jgi:hypothetical protein